MSNTQQLFENQISEHKTFVPITEKKWLTINEVTSLFPLTESQCRKHKRYGIPAYVIGKKLVFKKDDIDQWFEEQSA